MLLPILSHPHLPPLLKTMLAGFYYLLYTSLLTRMSSVGMTSSRVSIMTPHLARCSGLCRAEVDLLLSVLLEDRERMDGGPKWVKENPTLWGISIQKLRGASSMRTLWPCRFLLQWNALSHAAPLAFKYFYAKNIWWDNCVLFFQCLVSFRFATAFHLFQVYFDSLCSFLLLSWLRDSVLFHFLDIGCCLVPSRSNESIQNPLVKAAK